MQSYLRALMTPNPELKELTERLMLMAPFYNIKVVSQPYNRTIVTNLRRMPRLKPWLFLSWMAISSCS